MDNKKRTAVQAVTTLLQNAHLKGFFTGKIYTGNAKQVCVPGLNCYSCPGAVGSCPIGALQNALSSYSFKFPYYVFGLLIFFGALLGRLICGFLCPFGFLQDLMYRIPFVKKIKTWKGDNFLRYLKYLILLVMVVILPICIKLTPFYCKYLCPSGTLAGVLLSLSNRELFQTVGNLFTWKVIVLLATVIISMMICRPFCKYLCPLGAFYGFFNKVSFVRLNVDKDSCVNCGKCSEVCDMGVDPVHDANSMECIRCTRCVSSCPQEAIKLKSVL